MVCVEIAALLIGSPGTNIAAASALIGAVSAIFGVQTYRKNADTKRAEFLLQLHKAFFVDETYKPVRALLDDNGEAAKARLQLCVEEQSSDLTDFLNFFELIAYFESCGTLQHRDVRALLGYYLDLLRADRELLEYIARSETSFEHLTRLLQS